MRYSRMPSTHSNPPSAGLRSGARKLLPMLVSDLTHFLDMPEEAPGPARRLGRHFADIVRAATAANCVREQWTSALPCRRRPGHRPCPGRIAVAAGLPPTPIRWCCTACGDEGVITSWEGSPYDLRPKQLAAVEGAAREIVVSDEVAAALRDLLFLDPAAERRVFAMTAHRRGAALRASTADLEELGEAVAAEANHEPNRRRQRQLDAAFDAVEDAARRMPRGSR